MKTIELGSVVGGELVGGGEEVFAIDLLSDELVEIQVDQIGLDVALGLIDPDGASRPLVDSPTGRQGSEWLIFVSRQAGPHQVRVVASEPEARSGSFRLAVRARRSSGTRDRRLAEAELWLVEGDEARRGASKENRVQAVEHYSAARAAFRELQMVEREADCLFRLGLTKRALGEAEAARDFFQQALAIFRQSPSRHREVGFALNNLGDTFREMGRSDEALRCFDANLEADTELDIRAAALNNRGLLLRNQGETEQALMSYRLALDIFRELGEPRQEILMLNNVGELLTSQNQLVEAKDQFDKALEVLTKQPDSAKEIVVLGNRAEASKRQDLLPEAEQDLTRALVLARQGGNALRVAGNLNRLGTVQLLRGDRDKARVNFEEALDLFRENQLAKGEGVALHNLGRLELPDRHGWPGNPREALVRFEAAAPLLATAGDPQVEASNSYGCALAYQELGEYQKAREWLEGSLTKVESLRVKAGSENLRIAFFAGKQHYYDLEIDLLMSLYEKVGDADAKAEYAAQAFEVAERRRSRALLDLIGESSRDLREGADPASIAKEQQAQRKLNELGERRRASQSSSVVSAERLEQEIRQQVAELDEIRRKMRATSSPVEKVSPEPRPLIEIQKRLLDPFSLLLVYSLGERRSVLWLVSREKVLAYPLPDRQTIEQLANRAHRALSVHSGLSVSSEWRPILAELGEMLLGTAAAELGGQRLLIAADGNLLYIPFAALIEPGKDGGKPLVARHEIIHLPSASIVLSLRDSLAGREPAPQSIAIFADPTFAQSEPSKLRSDVADLLARARSSFGGKAFAPLPYTKQEAQEIGEIFGGDAVTYLGSAASKEKVLSRNMENFQIIHFATHGLLNNQDPELSGLVLSQVDPQGNLLDGFLRLHELYNLRLNAELVVLSACRTGLGQKTRGEGLLGLTRGFMYAGVPRVLVSLWNVSDAGTAELMKRFYWALIEGRVSPGMALRAAQLAMIEEDPTGQGLGHPYYWAPFVLQGEWRLPGEKGGGIEAAAIGLGGAESDGVDLPGMGSCDGLRQAWAKHLCRLLHRLHARGQKRDTTRGDTEETLEQSPRFENGADLVYSFGIDGLTGTYLEPPMSEREFSERISKQQRNSSEERELAWSLDQLFRRRGPDRRPMPGVDPKNLASSGWGIIFAPSTPNSVRDALLPLIRHRKEQANQGGKNFFQELEYQPQETKDSFLRRLKVPRGPADPRTLPYYLMIVGSPEEISYEFQYLLDLQYAVGRLYFEEAEHYGAYADSVLRAEEGEFDVRPEATFLGVRNRGDEATGQSFDQLIEPLARELSEDGAGWAIRLLEDGSKESLKRLFGGEETPALLFTSAHGLRLPSDHNGQKTHQGALISQDWSGGSVVAKQCLAAPDLGADARLRGLIAFLFGCYSAGTPAHDNFPPEAFRSSRLAPTPMVAPLAQALLKGGALAVLGHVDRAWTHAFAAPKLVRGHIHFLAFLQSLLDGHPVGSAMDWMNERFAEASTELTQLLDPRKERHPAGGEPEPPDPAKVSGLWRVQNNARNLVVLGDPAVRLVNGPRQAKLDQTQAQKDAEGSRQKALKPNEMLMRLKSRSKVDMALSPAAVLRAQRERKS